MLIRKMPAASVVVHSKTADPRLLDRGFGWTDFLKDTFQDDSAEFLASIQFPYLQWVDKVGLIMRARLSAKDTRKVQFTVLPSTVWDEITPGAGEYRVVRLRQSSADIGVVYSAVSTYSMSADPEIGFTVIPEDLPPNWDTVTAPPYQQILLGNGEWGLHFDKEGFYLLRKVLGVLRPVKRLKHPSRDYPDIGEFIIFFRVIHDADGRPKVLVSGDWGEHYDVYDPELLPGSTCVPDGRITFKGQGGITAFGIHQLSLYDGTYSSSPRDTAINRVAAATINPIWYGKSGANVIGSDVSTAGGRTALYQLTLQKGTQGGPWPVYKSPCVGAIVFRYPFVITAATVDDQTPWDQYLLGASLSKPAKPDESTATITFHHDAFTTFDYLGGLRWRKITLKLGYYMSDTTTEWAVQWVGYIRSVKLNRSAGNKWGQVVVEVQADNASIRFKRTKWKPNDVIPLPILGTPNNAAIHIANSTGVDSSYLSLDGFGDIVTMNLGGYEKPIEMIRPSEDKWSTLTRLFRYWNMEPYPLDDGRIAFRTLDYIPPSVSYDLYPSARSVSDIRRALTGIRHSYNAAQNATTIYTYGEVEDGKVLTAYTEDPASVDPTSEDFSLWEEAIIEEISGRTDPATIVRRNQSLSFEHYPRTRSPWEPEFEIAVDPSMQTNTRVAVHNCESVGIPDGQHHALVTLDHTYENMKGVTALRTKGGLRRIVNVP